MMRSKTGSKILLRYKMHLQRFNIETIHTVRLRKLKECFIRKMASTATCTHMGYFL